MTTLSVEQIIEKLAEEVRRLQKLCKDNGIDPTPPSAIKIGIGVSAKVTVFKTKEEAVEYQKKTMIS